MVRTVILPLGTLIYPMPHLSRLQIQISLACFSLPSAHTYHRCRDDPPSGPFSVSIFICIFTAWEDAFTHPWAPRYAGPWSNSTRWYYSLIQQRVYPSLPPVPNTLTIPILRLHQLQAGGTFLPF